jgi:hypothetical protein
MRAQFIDNLKSPYATLLPLESIALGGCSRSRSLGVKANLKERLNAKLANHNAECQLELSQVLASHSPHERFKTYNRESGVSTSCF